MDAFAKRWFIFTAVVLFVVFVAFYAALSDTKQFCVIGSAGTTMCIEPLSDRDLAILALTERGTSIATKANEQIGVTISPVNTRQTTAPLQTAQILLKDSSGRVLEIWDVKDEIVQAYPCYNFLGCSASSSSSKATFVMSFVPPQIDGTYEVIYSLQDKPVGATTRQEFARESTNFKVQLAATVCPKDYCSSWSTTGRANFGTYYARTCFTYGTTCQESRAFEYQTRCDEGYVIIGTSGAIANKYASCMLAPVEQPYETPSDQVQTPTQPTQPTTPTTDSANTTTDSDGDAPLPTPTAPSLWETIRAGIINLWHLITLAIRGIFA